MCYPDRTNTMILRNGRRIVYRPPESLKNKQMRKRLNGRIFLGFCALLGWTSNMMTDNGSWTESVRMSVSRLLQLCESEDEASRNNLYMNEGEAINLPESARIPPRQPIPSHLQLCQQLLDRHDQMQRGEQPADNQFRLEEDESVCMDWSSPHSSLMEIFASTLIGHVGTEYGINYQHNCARTRADMMEGSDGASPDVLTIQQIFPSSSLILDEETVKLPELLQLCKGCLAAQDQRNNNGRGSVSDAAWHHKTHHCILYPGSPTPLVDKETQEVDSVAMSEQLAKAASYPITSMMTAIADRLRMAAMDWNTAMNHPEYVQEQDNGAIIYVDDLSSTMKFQLYAKHIPRSVRSISILANPLCASQATCSKHVFGLRDYLDEQFADQLSATDGVRVLTDSNNPNNMMVELNEESSRILSNDSNNPFVGSSAASYSRMILSKYLICPPGTVNCLLPALAKEDDTYAVISENQDRPQTWRWFDFVRSGDANIQVAFVSPSANVVGGTAGGGGERETPPGNADGLQKFGTEAKDYREGCNELRGKLGSWEQDFHYNQLLTKDSLKLRGTTLDGVTKQRYKPLSSDESEGGDKLQRAPDDPGWQESDHDCDLDMLNVEGLCEVMHSMKLSILQFVGDEYTEEMVLSFWKLLGVPDADVSGLQPYVPGQPAHPRKYLKTIECQKEKYKFDIAFTTNDHLVHRPVEIPKAVRKPAPHVPRTAPRPAPTPAPTKVAIAPIGIGRGSATAGTIVGGTGVGPGWAGNGVGNGVVAGGNGYNNQCGCYPFQQQYNANTGGRQFIVAGTGANARSFDQYCNDLLGFQNGVRQYVNPNDVVMYRSAVPQFGACNCQNCPFGGRLLQEGEDNEGMPEEDIMKANAFLHKSVDEYRRRTKQYELSNFYHPNGQVGPKEHVLDITAMTQSHPHSQKAGGKHGRHLCQQGGFNAAPPVNAWNHMLYTSMRDIAAQEAYQRSIAPQMQQMNIPPNNPYAYPGAMPP